MIWDIADMFSKDGHNVVLITTHPSRPVGKYNMKTKPKEIIQVNPNLQVVRLNSFIYPKYNLFYRSFESWDFGYKAIKYINNNIKEYNIIYAMPWPFLGQLAMVLFNKNKKIPMVMNVQDLYPESFFIKFKNSWIIKLKFITSLLYRIDKYIAKKSSHITVVSNNFRDIYNYERRINEDKISIIENWQDESEFLLPIEERAILINKYQLDTIIKRPVFMYLGNIGPVAGIQKVIEEFSMVENNRFSLVIAGSGNAKAECIELVKMLNVENVCFIEVPPGLKSVVEIQSIADVMVLPINPLAASSSIPSKLIAYMFSSKPIICSAELNSDTGKVIQDSNCGWLVNDENPWHKIFLKVADYSSEELINFGKRGFEYAIARFSKSIGLEKIKCIINKVVEK